MNEIDKMRTWVAETARRLSTMFAMRSTAEIEALPDEQIVKLVEAHYPGGTRLARWTLRHGGEL